MDVTLTPTYQFQDPTSNPARDVALGFVVADPSDPCTPSWGGYYDLDEAADELELDRRIAQLRAAGGDALVSFGGTGDEELAVACTDPDALRDAYRTVIERYDATTIDLDIEGAALSDSASIERAGHGAGRAAGAAARRRPSAGRLADPAVSPDGLTADGLAVVEASLDAGLDVLGVNVMTMNFGSESEPTRTC